MEHLTTIERHLSTCNQCFRWAMLRWYDVADDHGACLAGRKLLPMLPSLGAALAVVPYESELEYELRTRTHALGR